MNLQYESDKIDKKEWMAEIIRKVRETGFYGKRTAEKQRKRKPTPF